MACIHLQCNTFHTHVSFQGAIPDMPYMPMVQQPPYLMQASLGPSMPPGMPPNPAAMPANPTYTSTPPAVPYTSIPVTYTTTPTYSSSPYVSVPGPTYSTPDPTVFSSSLPTPSLPAPIPLITTSTHPEQSPPPLPRVEHHRPRGPPLGVGGRQYSEEEPGPLSIIVPEKTPPPMAREPMREQMRDPSKFTKLHAQVCSPVCHMVPESSQIYLTRRVLAKTGLFL